MKRIACTIVSANYLHFAWTLAESVLRFQPDDEFHILLVDRLPEGLKVPYANVRLTTVEELGLEDLSSLAFKYNILELNTAVKPTFIKKLFSTGVDKLVYFDPDIYVFERLDTIYDFLDDYSAVLTPHILTPTADAGHVYERDFLGTGVFNLGFIALANNNESRRLLDWWEERCLSFCFEDHRSGLFVDQKWMNLTPCLFQKVHILHHVGCNVAYWNLQERSISKADGRWWVNDESPLIFFHFSGYSPEMPTQLSRKLRLPQRITASVEELLLQYAGKLRCNGAGAYNKVQYAYATFSNGRLIPQLARRLYSVTLDCWIGQDPFNSEGELYKRLSRGNLLSDRDRSSLYSTNNLQVEDRRVRFINHLLYLLSRALGGDRYTMLMKYLSYISILRNQRELLLRNLPRCS